MLKEPRYIETDRHTEAKREALREKERERVTHTHTHTEREREREKRQAERITKRLVNVNKAIKTLKFFTEIVLMDVTVFAKLLSKLSCCNHF